MGSNLLLGSDLDEMVEVASVPVGTKAQFVYLDSSGTSRTCEAIYVKFEDTSSTAAGNILYITDANAALNATTVTAAALLDTQNEFVAAGVCKVATEQDYYGWLLISGQIPVGVGASGIAAFTSLGLTSLATVTDSNTSYELLGLYSPVAIGSGGVYTLHTVQNLAIKRNAA